jgi:hypothetical protein
MSAAANMSAVAIPTDWQAIVKPGSSDQPQRVSSGQGLEMDEQNLVSVGARVAPGPAVLGSLGEIVHLPASEQVVAGLAPIIGGLIRDGKSVLRQGAAP